MTSDQHDLPPLPEIDWLSQFVPVYAREHMRAYAQSARAPLLAEIERLKIEAVKLYDRMMDKVEAAEKELAFSQDNYKAQLEANSRLMIERDELRAQLEAARRLIDDVRSAAQSERLYGVVKEIDTRLKSIDAARAEKP